jgi:hypothetical protein
LWLHPAFVNDFGVAFIQPCCNYIQPSMISNISKINMISIISNISYSPGRRWPEYSSSTETNAHECLFCPTSVFDSTWNKRRILQNQTLSIRSSKAPWDIPGGRMNTKSWRLDFLSFFSCKRPTRNALLVWVLCMPDSKGVEDYNMASPSCWA